MGADCQRTKCAKQTDKFFFFFSPALLQSTEKLTFWPKCALLRPAPEHVTLLASEMPTLDGAPYVKVLLESLSTESSVRVDVSLLLVAATRRFPGREEKFSLELL